MVQTHRPDGHLPPFELHLLLRSRPQRVPARVRHVVRRSRTPGDHDADPRSAVEIPQTCLFRRTADGAHHPQGDSQHAHQFLLRNLQREGRPAEHGHDAVGLYTQRFAASVPLSGVVSGTDPKPLDRIRIRFPTLFTPLRCPKRFFRFCNGTFIIRKVLPSRTLFNFGDARPFSYLYRSICNNL